MSRHHDVHVMADRKHEGWRVKQGRRTLSSHRKQSTAARAGKREARRDRVELVTHGRDGRIRSKDSYGNEGRRRDVEH